MTIEEFNGTRFYAGMIVEYKGIDYPVMSVDFEEALIGIVTNEIEHDNDMDVDYDVRWVRCENCNLLEE